MATIEFHPHDSQRELIKNSKRYTVLRCGRRWGKTLYALYLILSYFYAGKRVAFFAPGTSKFEGIWEKLTDLLAPVSLTGKVKIDRTKKIIRATRTKGFIQFWTLENPDAGRSQTYDLVIIDEAAFCDNLEYSWLKAIQPTLLDTAGDAVFMSTPLGTDNYFCELANRVGDNWYEHHAPSWTNTRIPNVVEEIDALRADLPTSVFEQEYGAEFIDDSTMKFFYSQGSIMRGTLAELNPEYPLWMSFDFNLDPCSVLISQKIDLPLSLGGGCFHYREHQVVGSIHQLCAEIRRQGYLDHPSGFLITGDSSGQNYSTNTLVNNYDIIRSELQAIDPQLIDTTKRNPKHEWSRTMCNTAFHMGFVQMDAKQCPVTDLEVKRASPSKVGKLLKDRDKNKNDMVDALRYQYNAWFPDGIPDIRQFKEFLIAA